MKVIHKTIGEVVEEISRQFPDSEALVHTEQGVRYTYRLLAWEVDRAAKGLVKLGIGKGDKVGIWGPNIVEWIISLLAVSKIGAIVVPIDPGSGSEDVEFILQNSECKGLIMVSGLESEEYVEVITEIKERMPGLEIICIIAETSYPGTVRWDELGAEGDEMNDNAVEDSKRAVSPEDPAAIMYTSGTTGRPKGVVLNHLGLVNKSMFSTERQGVTSKDRLCLFFPLFHMFGNTCIAMAGLFRGASLVMPCSLFDPDRVLPAIHKELCTAIYSSPSMLIALLDNPKFDKKKWATLSKGVIGGAPCPMELMRRLVEEIGVEGITVGYGITEASSWITMTHPKDPVDLRVSTIGTSLDCNEVKISDPASGEDLPPDIQGELCTRGFLMTEYFKMPAATAAAIDRDGWFHTGDLGVMDEQGYVKITGRLKDVIVRNGVEIHPVEVEEVIYDLPQVSEVQVFGFDHPEKGREIAAWVKIKDDASLSLESIEAHVEGRMPEGKVPRYFKKVSDFPMTRSGKVQKFKLSEMAEREYSQEG